MQLSKLYCNKSNFKNITFNLNGLNVVFAEVRSNPDQKNNSHDLGKTKLAEVIDFLLLKKIDKNHFFLKIKSGNISIFNDYIFYLELYLNSDQYLTIKRSVSSNTKISFALNERSINDFNPPNNWLYSDVAIDKARDILSDFLHFEFFQNKEYNYRKSINYSLRSQGDYQDVYKLNKFSAGKDVDWKPFMFDLLGFKGGLLKEKYLNDAKIEDIKKYIDKLKNEFSVRIEERDELIAEKDIIESEYRDIEGQIDRFNFYSQDKKLIENGIEDIETNISVFNSQAYELAYELDKLRDSIKNNFSFNLNKIRKVFEEAKIFFSDQLVTDYEQLISFNKRLTTERNKLLKDTLKEKELELNNINDQLQKLNIEREKLLSHLTDSDTFHKFKRTQKDLVKVEGVLLKIEDKINTIDIILNKESDIEIVSDENKKLITELTSIFKTTDKNKKYQQVRGAFTKFYKQIMDENATLSWRINTSNNVDFIPPKIMSKFNAKKDTAKDEGNTYMKLLCVSFDLAILTNYNSESYFRFVYHDDVLSQQDNGIKTRLLELINDILGKFNMQYIFSAIKSDLPVDSDDQPILFEEKDIVLKLHDKGPSGTLFGFEF